MAGQWWEEDKVEGSGDFWAADKVIDPASDAADPMAAQEVVTSARAFRGAGAGRGSINDPRRLDTPDGRRNVDAENELNRLEKINSGVERDELRKLAEFNVSQPKPAAKAPDRVEQYRKKGYEEKSAVVNAAFDQNVESRLNKPFQEREADPVTGERISRAYNPNTEAERVAAEEKEGALIRRDARQRAYAAELPGAVRGLAKGAGQAIGLAQGTVGLVGDLTGNEDLKQWGLEGYRDNMRQAGNLGIAKQFTEIKSADDAMGWAAENAGYVAFQAAQSILAGGMGGIIGNTIGKEALGTAVGLGLSNVMQTFGSVYGEAVDEAKKTGEPVDMRKVLIGATISSAIDTMADKIGLDAITAKGFKGNALSRAVKSVSMQVGVQGGTEAAQLVPEEFGAGRDPFRKGMADQYINEAAVGALGGAGPGLAGAINRNPNDAAAQALSSALDGGQAPMADLAGYLEANAQAPQSVNTPAGPVQVPQVDEKTFTIAARDEAMAAIGTAPTVDDAIAAANATVQLTGRAVQLDNDRLLNEALTNAGIADALAPVAEQAAESVASTVQTTETSAAPSASTATPAPVVWTGRRGDGYATPEDATRALGERQRLRPAYDWTVKQNAEGRFVLNGEPKGQITPAAGGNPTGNAQGASVLQNAPQSLSSQLTDAGYAQPKETVRELRDQANKVQRLQAAIARSGDDVSTIELYRGGRDSQDELGVGRRGASGAAVVARAIEEVGRAAQVAFGWRPIAITGLRNAFGVQYAGQVFINVEQVADGDSKGNTPELIAIQTIGHETTHALEKSKDPQDQADYARLREVVLANVKPGVVDSRVASEKEGQDYGEKEVVADISGSFWSDPSFWSRLYDLDDGSTMRRIAYKFMENATKFVKAVKGSRFDNERFINNVDQVREVAAQVWASKAKRGDSLFGETSKTADNQNSRSNNNGQQQNPPSKSTASDAGSGRADAERAGATQRDGRAGAETAVSRDDGRGNRDVRRLTLRELGDPGLPGMAEMKPGTESAAEFLARISAAKQANPAGASVAAYSADEYAQMRLFLGGDGSFGFAIKPDGDIVSVFKHPDASIKNAAPLMIRAAVAQGGWKLDAFDTVLPKLYSVAGMKAVARLRFNDEYAPDGWSYERYAPFNAGRPDVVFMVYDPARATSGELYAAGEGAYVNEYDEGVAAQDAAKYQQQPEGVSDGRQQTTNGRGDRAAQQGDGDRGQASGREANAGQPDAPSRSRAGSVEPDNRLAAPPRYGSPREGAVSVVGYHFSKAPRTSLSGAFYGSGLKGDEAKRLDGPDNSDIRPRVFFYVDRGNGVMPEFGVGPHPHHVKLDNIYDATADQLGLVRSAKGETPQERINSWERAIIKAGFDGYVSRDHVMPQHFAVLLGAKHSAVPVAKANPRRIDGKANIQAAPAAPAAEATRKMGEELVRRPTGNEIMEIIKAQQSGLDKVAPSFKMKYGEARVLESEAATADAVFEQQGAKFRFGAPSFSRADGVSRSSAAFDDDFSGFDINLDIDDLSNESLSFLDDTQTLQAVLQAELETSQRAATAVSNIEAPTAEQIAEAGYRAGSNMDLSGAVRYEPSLGSFMFAVPGFARKLVDSVQIDGSADAPKITVMMRDGTASFIQKAPSMDVAKRYISRQVAGAYLDSTGFDIAGAYRKGTTQKVAATWKAISKAGGFFKLPGAVDGKTFEQIADDLGAFKGYVVDVVGNTRTGHVTFRQKATGIEHSADYTNFDGVMECCTMGLRGAGGLGAEFYAVMGQLAENLGSSFKADDVLSGINAYRRTEQALSYALKSGRTDVLLPGPQNRVHGYNERPKTQEDHDLNIARLAIAGMRNAEELFPDVRRLSYDPATDKFMDSRGNDAEQMVKAALEDPEARAFGLGRSAIARAVITSQILKGSMTAADVSDFAKPIAYSKADVGLDEPMAEAWGDETGVTPGLRRFIAGSKIVNEDGEPIVMYHGTARDIEAFRAEQAGAVFLSYNPRFANDFAANSAEWMRRNYAEVLTPEQIEAANKVAIAEVMADKSVKMSERKAMKQSILDGKPEGMAEDAMVAAVADQMPTGENILPVFVRATAPFDFRIPANVQDVIYTLQERQGVESGEAVTVTLVKEGGEKMTVSEDDLEIALRSGMWEFIEAPEIQAVIRDDLGHDGFFVKELGQLNLAVYDPAQVKSVFNRGTFDTSDERLSFSRAALDSYIDKRNRALPAVSGAAVQEQDIALAAKAIDVAMSEMTAGSRESLPVPIGRVPHVLTMLGAPNQMMHINTTILRKVLIEKHSEDFVDVTPRALIEAIYQPALVMRGRAQDEFEIVTRLTNKNGPIIVPVKTNARLVPNVGARSSAVMSAYARKVVGSGDSLLNRIKDGKLLYADPVLAQSALTGRDSAPVRLAQPDGISAEFSAPSAGINVLGAQFPRTPPAASRIDNVNQQGLQVKPLNPNFVGWDQVRGYIIDGIAQRKVKDDVALMRWIGDRFNGDWADAPSFSRADIEESPNFKRWFGESKVVDVEGKPLVVYHGSTSGGINSATVQNTLFTPSREVANSYALDASASRSEGRLVVNPVYIRIENPLIVDAGGAPWMAIQFEGKRTTTDGIAAIAKARGHDGVLIKNVEDNVNDEDLPPADIYITLGKKGQIKSAIGNSGAFDPADPRISYSKANGGFDLPEETRTQKARRKMQDYFLRSRTVQEAIASQGGAVNEQTDFYRAEELSHGRIASLLQDFADKQVQPLMEKAVKFGIELDELSLYAYAMHAKERNAYIASIDKKLQDGGSGMTNAEADSILQLVDLSGDKAKFEELHTDLMTITRGNRMAMLADGLITQEEFNALEGAYDSYVPLRGFEIMDEDDKPTGRSPGKGFNIRGAETLKAKGRVSRAGQIIENIISDHQRTIVRGERNHVAKVFLNFALTNPDPDLWEIDATTTRKSIDRKTGRIARNTAIEKGEDTIAVKVKGHEIYVKVKDDLLLRALRKSYTDETGELTSDLMKSVGLYGSLLRNTLTRYNPEFAVVNAMRDIGFGAAAALDELGEKGMAKFLAHYAGAMAVSARNESKKLDANSDWGKWFLEYKAAGGTTSGFYAKGLEEIGSDIRDMMIEAGAAPKDWTEKLRFNKATRAAKGALRVLEWAGSVSENAARVSAYRTAREMGRTPSQAASIAKNLTTNFDRKGEYGQLLNALYLFYNAAIQGTQRTLKMFKNPKIMGYMAGVSGAAIGIAMANAIAGGDDPDDGMAYWDKIPAYVKERNIIIMLPPGAQVEGAEEVGTKGRYLTIPVQYGLNIFHVFGYQIADVIRHQSDPARGVSLAKGAINLASAVAGSFNPFGGAVDVTNTSSMVQAILPTVFDFPYQLASGTNAFGRDVAPFKSPFDSKPDSQNSNVRQTGSPAEHVAQWMNSVTGGSEYESGAVDISAGTVENFVRNLTGGTGVFIYDVLALGGKWVEHIDGGDPDLYVRDIPIYRRVTGETAGDVDQGLFYERRKAIQEARAIEKGAEEAGGEIKDKEKLALAGMNREAAKYTKYLSDVRKEMKALQKDDTLTTAERRLKMRELRAERDRLTAEFNASFTETMREELLSSRDSE